MPSYIFTNKVIEKMAKSGLERWQLEKTFEDYDRTEESVISGCKNYTRTKDGIEIGVMVKAENSKIIFVSTWKRKLFK